MMDRQARLVAKTFARMGNRLRVLIQRVQMSLRIKLFKDRGTVPAAAESAVHIDTAAADRKAGDGFIEHHRTMQVHGEEIGRAHAYTTVNNTHRAIRTLIK